MASVTFPQKSTFGTLTATRVNTTIVDNPAGDLSIRRANVEQLGIAAAGTIYRNHLVLAATYQLQDASLAVLIDPDDAGSIAGLAPITDALGVRTAIVDNPAGDLSLQRAGVTSLLLQASVNQSNKHLKLANNQNLTDGGNNTIIATDNAGVIDQLSEVGIPVRNPAGSQEVSLTPMELISPSQSGTLDEDEGFWYAAATDSLYLYLNTIFNFLMLKGTVHIETITVYINTSAVNDFVTALTFNSYGVATGTVDVNVTDPTDIGNGSTGNENGVLTVNTALVTDQWHRLKIDAVVGSSFVSVRAIKIKYRLT